MPIGPWSRGIPSSTWIRSAGHAFERLEGEDADQLVKTILDGYSELDWEGIHVWQRDIATPGWNEFEPGKTLLVREIEDRIRSALVERSDPRSQMINGDFPFGTRVLDVVLLEPNRWWIGSHVIDSIEQSWPGGVYPVQPPEDMVSRAYLKLAESLAWSQFHWKAKDRVVEIGSSPGGACQRLLELGFNVTGIDPAEMDPAVMKHPRFVHWRSKSQQLKRRLFSNFDYLVCDANVAPNYTLETVESIVTYPTSRFRGIILTLKLSAAEDQFQLIPQHIARVQSWGFENVKTRQLAFNRQEYCLVAW